MTVTTESPHDRTNPAGWADPVIERTDPEPRSDLAPLLIWCASLATATTLLLWLGAGRLATPPVTDPGAWWTWGRTGDPVVVTMAGLRILALGLAWYLTGVTGISVLARLLRVARLVRVADALSVGPVRVLAQQALGVGLTAGVLVAAVPSGPPAAPAPVTTVDGLPDTQAAPGGAGVAAAAAGATVGTAASDTGSAPVPAPRPPATGLTTAPEPPTAAAGVAAPEPATAAAGVGGGPDGQAGGTTSAAAVGRSGLVEPEDAASRGLVRTVEPGDSFWSIAEAEVAAHLDRAATEAEVHQHWQRLLAANADRLVVADDPDLLLPGQHLVLPAVGS